MILGLITINDASAVTETKLTASDAAADDRFGASVSISGDTMIVGANEDDFGTANDAGSAYIFERDSMGIWNEVAKITASDAADNDQFGHSVSISGDTALVGTTFDDDACPLDINCNTGSAYVFVKPVSGWGDSIETAKITASDAADNDQFGISVSISGDTALVGANFDDDACPLNTSCNTGSAYVFGFSTIIPVDIDIKPGNDDNCYNNDGSGHISVAIFGSDTFDVTTIDPITISLDSQKVKTKGSGDPHINIKDVNGDGIDDLVSKIIDVDGTYEVGIGTATLTGQLFDGTSIMGSDFICIKPLP